VDAVLRGAVVSAMPIRILREGDRLLISASPDAPEEPRRVLEGHRQRIAGAKVLDATEVWGAAGSSHAPVEYRNSDPSSCGKRHHDLPGSGDANPF
jgi:hypothetical protein